MQVMDYGYPQFTEAQILQEFIKTDSYRMEVGCMPSSSGGSCGGSCGSHYSSHFDSSSVEIAPHVLHRAPTRSTKAGPSCCAAAGLIHSRAVTFTWGLLLPYLQGSTHAEFWQQHVVLWAVQHWLSATCICRQWFLLHRRLPFTCLMPKILFYMHVTKGETMSQIRHDSGMLMVVCRAVSRPM